jgi:hypothetical protein
MELQGGITSGTSDTLQIKSLQLAKSKQEQDGQAAIQLIESAADVPKSSSANSSIGSIVDTFA